MHERIRFSAFVLSTLLISMFGASTASAQMVSLTFDDGWQSQYEEVVPLLEAAGMESTFYIISGTFDESEYMSADEVADLAAMGHEIGAHSVNHAHLADIDQDDLAFELAQSKADLEEVTGTAVRTFAYPYGEYDDDVLESTEAAGYTTARTADDGFNDGDTEAYLLRAYTVEGDTSIDFVKDLIDEAKSDGTWLIISFHHIDDSGDQYSIPADYVAEVIGYLKESGVPEVTVSKGYDLLHGTTTPPVDDDEGTSTPPTDDEGTSTPPTDDEGTSTPPTDDDEGTSTPPTDEEDEDGDDQGNDDDEDDDDDDMESGHHHRFSIENYRVEVRARISELRGRFR